MVINVQMHSGGVHMCATANTYGSLKACVLLHLRVEVQESSVIAPHLIEEGLLSGAQSSQIQLTPQLASGFPLLSF